MKKMRWMVLALIIVIIAAGLFLATRQRVIKKATWQSDSTTTSVPDEPDTKQAPPQPSSTVIPVEPGAISPVIQAPYSETPAPDVSKIPSQPGVKIVSLAPFLKGRPANAYSIRWVPGQDKLIAHFDGAGAIEIYDLRTQKSETLLELTDKKAPQPLSMSPDGKKLLIRENWVVYCYDLESKSKTQLFKDEDISGFFAGPFDWAPDGEHFVFEMDRSIWVFNEKSNNIRVIMKVSEMPGAYVNPRWSPKGNSIMFSKALDWTLYLVSHDGSDMRKIVDKGSSAVWFFDATRICYGWNGKLYIYNMNFGKIEKTIEIPENKSMKFNVDHSFSASPKGNMLAYTLTTITIPEEYSDSINRLANMDIYLYDIETDTYKNLTNTKNIMESNPLWSHDGKKILCFAYYTPERFVSTRMTPFIIEME